jgi:predicted amidophosphoribosyltransferase
MLWSMNLFPCPSCKQSVSKKAKACPHCGHAFKPDNQMSLKDPVHLIGAVLVAAFVLALLSVIVGYF